MTFRDYMGQVERDARKAIEEGAGWYDARDSMYGVLFTDDALMGNGTGLYTFNAAKAAENACGLVFDDKFIAEAGAAGYAWSCSPRGWRRSRGRPMPHARACARCV